MTSGAGTWGDQTWGTRTRGTGRWGIGSRSTGSRRSSAADLWRRNTGPVAFARPVVTGHEGQRRVFAAVHVVHEGIPWPGDALQATLRAATAKATRYLAAADIAYTVLGTDAARAAAEPDGDGAVVTHVTVRGAEGLSELISRVAGVATISTAVAWSGTTATVRVSAPRDSLLAAARVVATELTGPPGGSGVLWRPTPASAVRTSVPPRRRRRHARQFRDAAAIRCTHRVGPGRRDADDRAAPAV